jgi:ABC-2 type transport system ATP-binding protein
MLVLDEPFSGLDPKQIALLKETILQQRNRGKLVLLSSHLLDLVENLCDKYVIIKQGKLVAEGSRQELLSKTSLPPDSAMERIYLNLVSADE